jgi:predicted nucleotidyltransferase
MEVKAYINDNIGKELRDAAIKRFSYFRGSLSKAVEEAVIQWLRRNEKLENRLDKLLKKAEKDPNVLAVFVFGSFAEKKTSYRDVDLAFFLKEGSDETSVLADYEDSSEDPKFDISCINSLAVRVRKEVLENGSLLLCKNKPALYNFVIGTIREYEEFKHIYELMIYGRNQ